MNQEPVLIKGVVAFPNPNRNREIRLVIYKRGCYSLRFFLYDEGDWLTEFPIGTPRPPINVSASLHHSAFDSASWDKSLLPFHGLI